MVFHKTCRTLPIYNFNEILLSKDLRFLIKGFDEDVQEDLELSSTELISAHDIYKSIIYEYAELTANNSIISKYKSEFLINSHMFRYEQAVNILDLYSKYKDIKLLNILNRLEIRFKEDEDVNEQISKITKKLRGLKTNVDVLKIKHSNKFEKDLKVGEEKIEHVDRLDSEAIALELNLKLGYSLNTKKISVSRWVTMWNISNKIKSKDNGKG